jgi:hypothetical protein
MNKIKYLKKANDDVISFCSCNDGLISYPAQADCPWCGCGWLFTCKSCRKPFTFAECIEVESTYEKIAKDDLTNLLRRDVSEEEIAEWVKEMKEILTNAEVGKTYIIMDGKLIDKDQSGIKFEGWFAKHDLDKLPQIEAVKNPEIMHEKLTNESYWRDDETERTDRFGIRILRR